MSVQPDLFEVAEPLVPATSGCLTSWRGTDWPVAADWQPLVAAFMHSPEGLALAHFIRHRVASGAIIYPPEPLRMLALTPLAGVRVVILGQDPYHGPGQAEGLAFSVPDGVRVPPSLRNVYKELARDLGGSASPPSNGSLMHWATQGVLLLNTCLTVEDGQPASHTGRGWEVLTRQLVHACNDAPGRRVFMLWGAHAQTFASHLDSDRHLVLKANHPSPLSANRGPTPFMGCGHFGLANQWMQRNIGASVDWLAKTEKVMA